MNAWALVALIVRMNLVCNLALAAIAFLLAAMLPCTSEMMGRVLLVISGAAAVWTCRFACRSVHLLRRGA